MIDYSWIIPVLPLISFVLLGLVGHKLSARVVGWCATLCMCIAFGLACGVGYAYWTAACDGSRILVFDYRWLSFAHANFTIGILIDQISALMLILITGISALVHLYSISYMGKGRAVHRYFAYFGLFSFAILGVVVATNIFQMYLFWELVGVSSYLLIGYYYIAPAAVSAAKKAFIVTRFADCFFLIGILLYGFNVGSYAFEVVNAPLVTASATILPLSLALIFIGGAGKSAMFPLHIWLPDAMEGPTPVSALIHAATMVVAGVFLVARMFPLYIGYAPEVLHSIAIIGLLTALYGACVACVQTDIKRVLAFSTISQIGFMMIGLGVSTSLNAQQGGLGYMAALFHLFTHGLFKALLFLGAGCIIHSIQSNDLSGMGQLRKAMPITHATFLIACLALAGVYPFAGFFSKDGLLSATFAYSPWLGGAMSLISAMTAFYIFRLYFRIFWGKRSAVRPAVVYKTPVLMLIPLVLLAVGTCVAGFIPFGMFVSSDGKSYHIQLDAAISIVSTLLSCVGIVVAGYMYMRPQNRSMTFFSNCYLKQIHHWALHRFYIDSVYQFITHRVIFAYISKPIAWFDKNFIDGFFDYLGRATYYVSTQIRHWQSGRVQQYAIGFIVGIILLTLVMIF